jgi:hypothetical protein
LEHVPLMPHMFWADSLLASGGCNRYTWLMLSVTTSPSIASRKSRLFHAFVCLISSYVQLTLDKTDLFICMFRHCIFVNVLNLHYTNLASVLFMLICYAYIFLIYQ